MADIPQTSGWQDIAAALSAASGGRLNGRTLQALLDLDRYKAQGSQFATSSNNALQGAKFALDAPSTRASQSVRGDIMANGQDAHVTGLPSYIKVPQSTGGLRPSMFSDNTRAYGAGLSRDALAAQMAGGDKVAYPTAPALPDVPEASALDTGLNAGSSIASILAALDKLGGKDGGGLLDKLKNLLGGGGPGGGPGGGNGSQPGTGYNGPGTPGYPGDGNSSPNNPVPPGGTTPGGVVTLPDGSVVDENGNIISSPSDPTDSWGDEGGSGGGD